MKTKTARLVGIVVGAIMLALGSFSTLDAQTVITYGQPYVNTPVYRQLQVRPIGRTLAAPYYPGGYPTGYRPPYPSYGAGYNSGYRNSGYQNYYAPRALATMNPSQSFRSAAPNYGFRESYTQGDYPGGYSGYRAGSNFGSNFRQGYGNGNMGRSMGGFRGGYSGGGGGGGRRR